MKKVILLTAVFFCSLQIITYAQPGRLDSSFGVNGIVRTDTVNYTCSAIEPDGKIVAAGDVIARYNSDGSLDNTFKYQSVDYSITSIALQSDGKIVVAGSVIARYNSDGSPDNTFSGDGRQTIDFSITSMAIQSDGKIVVAGDSSIARFIADGEVDISFSEDGVQTTDFPIASLAIQKDGKIVVAGTIYMGTDDYYGIDNNDFAVARFNYDGSLDNGFAGGGIITANFYYDAEFERYNGDDKATSVAIQSDGKIVAGGTSFGGHENNQYPELSFSLARYNTDGSTDITQRAFFGDYNQTGPSRSTSMVIQNNGSIIIAGDVAEKLALARFEANGNLDYTFGDNGKLLSSPGQGYDAYVNLSVTYDSANDKLYAVGRIDNFIEDYSYGALARYLLDEENKTPTISLTIPYNIVKYSGPARIKLNASVANISGTIKKVQFYNGTTLLHTETEAPYGFLWVNVPAGNYTLTGKATDNNGNVITSNSIQVSVEDYNVPPVVSIVSPVNDTTYTGPATIRLIANAKDPNDKISKVEFYNGSTLLRTEYYYPYTYTWSNVQPGTYTITAKAYDDKGLSAASAPVTTSVKEPSGIIAGSKPYIQNSTEADGPLSLKVNPNPAGNTLNIYTTGLQTKPSIISVLSASGVVMKTINANTLNPIVQLDVSSLVNGVYTIKVICGDKVMYKQFVKL